MKKIYLSLFGVIVLLGSYYLSGFRFFAPEHGRVLTVVDGVPIFVHEAGHDQRGDFGLRYQCVEFVNRYLALHGHRNLARTGHAMSYFTAAERKGLTPYPNGGVVAPEIGDVIVFGSSVQQYGHVGIVAETGPSYVVVAQQNATATALGGLMVKPLPLESFELKKERGRWTITPRPPLTCLGWSRPPPKKSPW